MIENKEDRNINDAITDAGMDAIQLIKKIPEAILCLNEMNITGPLIWIAFEDYCGKDLEKFIQYSINKDQEMIDFVFNNC